MKITRVCVDGSDVYNYKTGSKFSWEEIRVDENTLLCSAENGAGYMRDISYTPYLPSEASIKNQGRHLNPGLRLTSEITDRAKEIADVVKNLRLGEAVDI